MDRHPARLAALAVLSASLVLTAASAGPARAQTPEPDMIPRELAEGLYSLFPMAGRAPVIVVGRAPEGFPDGLVPAGWQILGGAQGGASRQLLLRAPVSVSEALRIVEATMRQGGWTEPAVATFEPTGFLTSDMAPRGNMITLCRDDQPMSVVAGVRAAGGSLVMLRLLEERARSMCTEDQSSRRRVPDFFARSPIPALRPPPGARVENTGSGGNDESRDSRALIRGPLSVAELMEHYGRQLREAGWQPEEITQGSGAGAQAWRLTGPDGEPWQGGLFVLRHPGGTGSNLLVQAVRVAGREGQ